jgi:hypothetical protein
VIAKASGGSGEYSYRWITSFTSDESKIIATPEISASPADASSLRVHARDEKTGEVVTRDLALLPREIALAVPSTHDPELANAIAEAVANLRPGVKSFTGERLKIPARPPNLRVDRRSCAPSKHSRPRWT